MAPANSDRNLLFGILALQMDFISREALIKAMNAWVLEKAKGLGQILVEQKALSDERQTLLEALVQEHLKQHGNNPEKSLAAVSSVASVQQELQQIADSDLHESLARAFAARPDDESSWATRAPSVGTPTSSGLRFRILRPHAEGGLGRVSVARDEELHREVALKEIKDRHADDPNSRSRFIQEAEITGGLEHPGIVPVYGLGQYADGRPFYAMRFIRGDSLKEAIERFHNAEGPKRDPRERSLELRKLLGRFLNVCNAVAYAHSRGVLHRDLKPGNIMLGQYGETLVVDWGLAKPVDRPEGNHNSPEGLLKPASASGSAPTQMGSAIGTPQYMSPEQAAGRLDLLGPASDVYSLGSTLYCLLTGQPPVSDPDQGIVLQKVQNGSFPRPRQVKPTVPLALEAICLKALALQPSGRYGSPRALADDVEHWLADEAVTAYREPIPTRLLRWGRRHRTAVTAAAVLLVTAVVGLSIGLFLLERKQTEIIQERNTAQLARDRAQKVAGFFQDYILAAPRPKGFEGGASPQVTLREVLDRAAPQIEITFSGQPELEAAVRHSRGVTYYFLGRYAAACVQGEKAYQLRLKLFGPDHPDTILSAYELAESYNWAGKYDKSLALYRNVVDRGPRVLGPEKEEILYAPLRMASVLDNQGNSKEAESLLRRGIEACKNSLGPTHHHTFCGQARLADVLASLGQAEQALALKQETYEGRKRALGEEAYDTLLSMGEWGSLLRNQGKLDQAEPVLRRNQELRTKVLGPEHALTLYSIHHVAFLLEAQGKLPEAESLHRQVLEIWLRTAGPDDGDTQTCRENLASNLDSQGKLVEAAEIYEQTLAINRRVRGPEDASTLDSMFYLAKIRVKQKKFAGAEELFRQLITANTRVYGPEHAATVGRRIDLAGVLDSQGQRDEAAKVYQDVLAIKRKTAEPLDLAVVLVQTGDAMAKAGRLTEGTELLHECLSIREKHLPANEWRIGTARSVLGGALAKQEKFADAEPYLLTGYEILTKSADSPPVRVSEALERIILLYERWSKEPEAEKWRKKRTTPK